MNPPIIKIKKGIIKGFAKNGVNTFLGIPYAQPPIKDLRWKAPQEISAWSDVKECTKFSKACPQLPSRTGHGIESEDTSEDCLYLNVWTPINNLRKKLPVMVWIHGGAFINGGSSLPLYNGENLAKKNVIIVTFNYRLGPFGFLAHPLLDKENPGIKSGNFGLLDQITALTWVKDNIAFFGGDNNKITIFGQSAGAFSICRLMVSPLAKNLFQQAIIESGNPAGDWLWLPANLPSLEKAHRTSNQLIRNFNLKPQEDVFNKLRLIPAEQILKKANQSTKIFDKKPFWGPVTDNWLIPNSPKTLFENYEQIKIPTIIGTNANEGSIFINRLPIKTILGYKFFLHLFFGKYTSKILNLYPLKNKFDLPKIFEKIITDFEFGCPARFLADIMVKNDKTFLYYFNHQPNTPLGKELGVFHGAEINYVFGNFEKSTQLNETDRQLNELLMNYWVNFAKTGNPNSDNLIHWSNYQSNTQNYLEFNHETKMKTGYYNKIYPLLKNIWQDKKLAKQNYIQKIILFLIYLIKFMFKKISS